MSAIAITRPLQNALSLPPQLPQASKPTRSGRLALRPSRHPPALWLLSVAEAGERFGFYLMLAIFTLFLNERLGFSESRASDWYGLYLAAVYATPLVGGWLAGRYRSRQFWVMSGVLALAVGYFALGFSRPWSVAFALALLAAGNGLFKPNINVLIGNLYPPEDQRRDEAFGIFYMAVNAGGVLGPLIGEVVRGRFGWSAAFCLAGVSLLGSGLTLHWGRGLLTQGELSQHGRESDAPAGRRILALIVLSLVLIPFWTAYHQHGSSLAFWARDGVDRSLHLFGSQREIPPGWFSGSSAAFVLVLTPLIAILTRRLRASSIAKIIAGVCLGALSFAILWLATKGGGGARVHPGWLLGHYMTMTLGELLLAPIGLSVVSKLAPARWSGVLFGLWYVSAAVGNWLSGSIVRLWMQWTHERFFGFLALLLLSTAGLLLTQRSWLGRTLPPNGT